MKVQEKHQFNVGKWLPKDYELIRNHIKGIKSYVAANPTELTPNILALDLYVKSHPQISQWSNDMFTEVPRKYQYSEYGHELQSWDEFIPLLNGIMTMTMTFNTSGCVGFPINALLDWAMGTPSGHNFFLDDGVNEHFNKVLNDWGEYLKSHRSVNAVKNSNEHVTDYPGHFIDFQYYWLSDKAMVALANALNDGIVYNDYDPKRARKAFIKAFDCPDTSNVHYGFKSWDDFFTRQFNPGQRPIAEESDVIANACESGPYRVAYNVQRKNAFWMKGQPYSLLNIFNETEGNSPLTDKYEGGTIYQAFLSAESYHRWHSPVDGVVKTVYDTASHKPFNSTYYSELLPVDQLDLDPSGPNESQGYISNVATRGIIEIGANNPAIGDMCVIPVGMAECATCDITVNSGDEVKKGDEIGMFHFGGSTHLLVFQKDVNLLFDYHGERPGLSAKNIHVNSKIATVVDKVLEYPTENGESGLRIGLKKTFNKNAGAVLAVVPSDEAAFPINVGNGRGQYLWGVNARGCVDKHRGTEQPFDLQASSNLHFDFPNAGSSGYIIGDNPNDTICAALKIVVPEGSQQWPLVVSDTLGNTIWGVDCQGNVGKNNPVPMKETATLHMHYPSREGGSNGLVIGDVNMTLGCYGGISIIVPEYASSDIYAIAVVDASGDLLWGVDSKGKEVKTTKKTLHL
ncbi:phosphatidylserine decarboxylase family protein [Flammeovirga sp. SJP92]|uniref:phosphatidylserine decarboxylase family protein n=1 Tax=Flammeovirga sp. SJP92 TaxID=1775430 RepID=UPI000786C0C9|nr:phosphatidylserine decarboxylase family protein [Flammeovirga sp. SJP92]KXX67454.1 hypothetical protein AVL50_29550 [Flammeovirga sp. SJP92]